MNESKVMAIIDYDQVMTDAKLGGGIIPAIQSWKRKKLQELNRKTIDLKTKIEGLLLRGFESGQSPSSVAETAANQIASEAEASTFHLAAAAKKERNARQEQNSLKLKHNIVRDPEETDSLTSCTVLGAMATIEGAVTGLFFLGGGFVPSVAEAMGLGFTISIVNIILSAGLGGFICGRYWNYGLKAREDDSTMKQARLAGRIGCVLVAAMISCLLLASGIVRATGETQGLSYSLESISLAASDFHSLMLWFIGISFSIISWRKGLSAFSDPYPGLTKASKLVKQAEENIELIYEDARFEIEEIYEDAVSEIEDIEDQFLENTEMEIEEVQEVCHLREEVLSDISQAKDEFAEFFEEQVDIHQKVTGTHLEIKLNEQIANFDVEGLLKDVPSISINQNASSKEFSEVARRALVRVANSKKALLQLINQAYQKTLR